MNKNRITRYDGLRGIAALIVMFHHLFLVWPQFYPAANALKNSGVLWWFVHTPLKLVWSGFESVVFFFVLSGFALTQSCKVVSVVSLFQFYLMRILRIYPALWFILTATIVMRLNISYYHFMGWSTWLREAATEVTVFQIVQNYLLVAMDSKDWSRILPVIWSLKYEVIMSAIFPVLLAIVKKWSFIRIAILMCAMSVLTYERSEYFWMSIGLFATGIWWAQNFDTIKEASQRLGGSKRIFINLIGLFLITADAWYPQSMVLRMPAVLIGIWIGVLSIMWTSLSEKSWGQILDSVFVQWLGRISYSLFLVHTFWIVFLYSFVPFHSEWALVVPIAVVVASLATAHMSFRFIEAPFIRLSKRIIGQNQSVAASQNSPSV